ncbi:hypothetical protein SMACR_05119 [Sordaria macrospora]|uniref:WGS project CABT00000000 data, contig 2.22 n=2 Tax=Sordaria macrospora TaxID=5147 RepID=F7W2Q5_SORMK|nr:uncharacterized protein SMAC_05119 [Sordaria macrospora k-hell]KAA8632036.1 hypothetical protein SMACR_05119 [Sordaria macrospora]CCC11906.1 unnamed protein product [Sordaria macrospora k-hell]
MSSPISDLKLAQPLTLPNGLVLPNRLIKAAMAEQLGFGNHLPNPELNAVYATWARGDWGMILTGNVQVDPLHKGDAHDIAPGHPGTTPEQTLTAFRAWADAALLKSDGVDGKKESKTPVVIQINHPGRQSPMGAGTRGFLEKAVAPSAVPLVLGEGLVPRLASKLLFGTPRELTVPEIKDIVKKFGATVRITAEAGFQGVEIHAAHGYLLAQFLSKKTNKRTDEYGGSAEKRARIVGEIIEECRRQVKEALGEDSEEARKTGNAEETDTTEEVLRQIELFEQWGVDFVEVSGGSYEDPQMANGPKPEIKQKSERTKAREAFFLEFAKIIRTKFPQLPLMVTGGFRTRQGMEAALASDDCDMIGIGRPAIINPSLPANLILNPEVPDADARLFDKKVEPHWIFEKLGMKSVVGAGAEIGWYVSELKKLAKF